MSWRWGRKISGVLVATAAATAGFYKPSTTMATEKDVNRRDCVSPSTTAVSVPVSSSSSSLSKETEDEQRLRLSIERATELCERVQRQLGLPGLSVAVAVNGQTVYQRGFGYADIENGVAMTPSSVIRIASISKPLTMAMLAQLLEAGKIDLNLPIQHYLPDFPQKTFEGEKVTITTRHLLSHISGIRHYKKKSEIEEDEKKKKEQKAGNDGGSDAEFREFFSKTPCENVSKALELFQNDELIHKPGTKYFYTTHGWTVVSAIIEKISGVPFDKHAQQMFTFWGLHNTYLDKHEPIIPNRARHYSKNKNGFLINSPWVDNSCKWAGGGFISNVLDLVRFAHIMMYCVQQPTSTSHCQSQNQIDKKAFLKRETVEELWKGEPQTKQLNIDHLYGQGWVVGDIFSNCVNCNGRDSKFVLHSGGAVGATSILFIQLPSNSNEEDSNSIMDKDNTNGNVKGVVVAMITNLIGAGLGKTAMNISKEFEWMI